MKVSTDCYQTELYGLPQPFLLQFCNDFWFIFAALASPQIFIPVGASGMFLRTKNIQGPKGQPAYAPNYWSCEEYFFFLLPLTSRINFFWWSRYCLELSCFLWLGEHLKSLCFLVCSVQCPGRNQQPEISRPDCVIMEAINQIILPARGEYCLRGLSKCQLEMEAANKELPVFCWNRLRKLYCDLEEIFAAFTLIFYCLIMSSSINHSFSPDYVPISFVNISKLCFGMLPSYPGSVGISLALEKNTWIQTLF